MTLLRKMTGLFLALILLVSLPLSVSAAQADVDDLIRDLINYFRYYTWEAETDFDLILTQMEGIDPALSETWSGILDFWTHLIRDMEVHNSVLPDGLPEDDSLCIAVMGYYLKSDGGIRDELKERLQVTLESAKKYPNAYILCTGGSTASENKKVSEASQMAKWLIKKGIPEERIIIEDQASSTIENAQYGCRLLYRDYPQVSTLAVITSDYHIFRSCLYFNTQAALDAYELGTEPMKVAASATCRIKPNSSSDLETQVEGMSILTGIDVEGLRTPSLTTLEEIRVAGAGEYELGQEPDLIVSAVYSNGFTREVTHNTAFSEFDPGSTDSQTVTATYSESSITKTASVEIRFLSAPTREPIRMPAESSAPTGNPEETAAVNADTDLALPFAIWGICLLLLAVLLRLKACSAAKRRRRPKPTIDLS